MPVIYTDAVKTVRMTATRDHFAGGEFVIRSTGSIALAVFVITATGGTVTGDTWTIGFVSDTVNAMVNGTAATALLRPDPFPAIPELTGLTVGTTGSGSDLILDNINIIAGQPVTISSATIQHAP